MVNPAIIGVIGLGAGAAIGYVAASTMGTALPKITLSKYQVPVGQTYTITCENFPPNTQLVAPQSINPNVTVNMGITDGQGKLTLNATAQGPAGWYYIIVWNATDGKYCAMTTLNTT